MVELSTHQIQRGLQAAGFPRDLIPIMTAIVFAESGGNPTAHNNNVATGDNSYGLLQINMINEIGRERREKFSLSSNRDLFEPSINFMVAKQIYDQQGLEAWGSYRNASYKQFLEEPLKCLPSNELSDAFDSSQTYSYGVKDLLLKAIPDGALRLTMDRDDVSSVLFKQNDIDPLIKPVSMKKLSKRIRHALDDHQPVTSAMQYWDGGFNTIFFQIVEFTIRKERIIVKAELLPSAPPNDFVSSEKLHSVGLMLNID